jgi:hypothetical protein
MFEAIGSWLVQLFHGWRIEAIHWLSIYGVFVLVCCIIAAIVFGLHLLWRSLPGRWPISILGILGLMVWGALGNPTETITGWIWPHSPAPWERVDAFYYPDKASLTVAIANHDVGGLAQCRTWATSAAATQNDPQLERGDYECGVGYLTSQGSLNRYRLTVR